jgi:hypothetical protein
MLKRTLGYSDTKVRLLAHLASQFLRNSGRKYDAEITIDRTLHDTHRGCLIVRKEQEAEEYVCIDNDASSHLIFLSPFSHAPPLFAIFIDGALD